LPLEYREPLVLQVLMGYSTAEIARELKLSGAAVLTRLFRARNQLRVLMGADTRFDTAMDTRLDADTDGGVDTGMDDVDTGMDGRE
jgi:RNA polymerase sigma-70 factor (ECF subfamily)